MIRRLIERRRFMREHRWTSGHLSDYVDHDLDEHATHRVEDHLGICPECWRVLRTLRRTLADLRSIGERRATTQAEGGVAERVIEGIRPRL